VRIANRLAAILLALILIAGGLLVVVQTVSALAGQGWPIPESWWTDVSSMAVSDNRVLTTSVIVALVGLIALIGQFIRRRPRRLPATRPDGQIWWLSRRSVERRSADAATYRAGVQHARVSVRGQPDQWQVHLSGEVAPHHFDAAEQSVRDELASVGAPAEVAVTTSLHRLGRVA
jgi:hypothetical protein